MDSFQLDILTPSKRVYSAKVKDLILPAYDGEVGVLPHHGDFVGVLGTGVLRAETEDSHTHICMICSGIYQVKDGAVTLFADLAMDSGEIDPELERDYLGKIHVSLESQELSNEQLEEAKFQERRAKAKLDAVQAAAETARH